MSSREYKEKVGAFALFRSRVINLLIAANRPETMPTSGILPMNSSPTFLACFFGIPGCGFVFFFPILVHRLSI
jgi:hypothetical protein